MARRAAAQGRREDHAQERGRAEYEPGSYLPFISPTPLLLMVAAGDHLVPSEHAIAAYETAHQPKELVIVPGGHFDAYVKSFETFGGRARDWFTQHLA